MSVESQHLWLKRRPSEHGRVRHISWAGGIPRLTKGEKLWDQLYSGDAAEALWQAGEKEIDGRTYSYEVKLWGLDMNVVYYSSDFFSEMCGVAMESLCANNRDSDMLTIYVVEDHISGRNKDRLRQIAAGYNRRLVFIRMPSQREIYPQVKMDLGRTYARMALGELLPPEVDRVLSLDSDTLVLDSLRKLYATDFEEDQYVAGVYDCVGEAIQKGVLKVKDSFRYCNAGMFLIDLKKWRELDVGGRLLKTVAGKADGRQTLYFLEQDLMNITFDGHLKLLHPRYNVLTSVYYFDYPEVMRMKRPVGYYTREQVEEAKRKPALVHATTCFYIRKRMWVKDSDHPYAKFYLEYREKTPWSREPQVRDGRKLSKRLYAGFWHCMPRSWAVALASLMINKIRPAYARITGKANLPTVARQS